jgi:CrcB protein
MKIFLVFLGGGIGSALRYGLMRLMEVSLSHGFPWGVLIVNITGSFFIGAVYATSGGKPPFEEYGKFFFVAGILGGFTTFSAFSYDVLLLFKNGQVPYAIGYMIASMLFCPGMAALAYYLLRS